jgi:hypothetical protein
MMSALYPALIVPLLLTSAPPQLISLRQKPLPPPRQPAATEPIALVRRPLDLAPDPLHLPTDFSCDPCAGPWEEDLLGSTRASFADAGSGAIDSTEWRLSPLHDDAVIRDLLLPFSFPFYYGNYDTLAVGINGFLSLQGGNLRSEVGARPTPLPCVLQPHAVIAPLWTDLLLGSGAIYFHADSDSAVVEWHELSDAAGDGPYTLQARLYPNGEFRFLWRSLPATLPEELVIGAGDARGLDGWTLTTPPTVGQGVLIRRPSIAPPVAALDVLTPDYSLHRGASVAAEILLGNPAEIGRSTLLRATITAHADGTIEDISPPDSISLGAHELQSVLLSPWTPPHAGLYDLVATAQPHSGVSPASRTFLVHSAWDTLATLANFESGQPADTYALNDAGEWAIRFDVADYLGLNASLVRIYFWEGWPDHEIQSVEVQLIGADGEGAPDAAIEYSSTVTARGGSGFVTIPLPDSTQLVADPVYVVIRQPLPFPDCESIAVDSDQGAGSFRRHWVRACDDEQWQTVEKPVLSGDLYVELYLSGSVGIAAPGGSGDSDPGDLIRPPSGDRPRLLAPAPVPANPHVRIAAELPAAVTDAEIIIYNLAGERIRQLHRGPLAAGHHEFTWAGRTDRGTPVPSGIYWVRLRAAHSESLRRLLILR